MINNSIEAKFAFQVMLRFLRIAHEPLRQLLNQCQLSIGLTLFGDSAFFIDSKSLPIVKVLGQEQTQNLALIAETLGFRWIVIRYGRKLLYTFNVDAVLQKN
ncbi:MAG: hypothetical protein JOZ78_01395 [Chroococcidiopsidaceae cyanobacterium CP_BM_ER_R8_30]|nr:hypothetical protein [Chroococcidiopsidaceae cyanobacterium CP_BM_ER_R8_30]